MGRTSERGAQRWEETGELPDDLGDLRALLFLEHRRERFVYIGIKLVEGAHGVSEIREDPTAPDRIEQDACVLALFNRIADIVRAGERT